MRKRVYSPWQKTLDGWLQENWWENPEVSLYLLGTGTARLIQKRKENSSEVGRLAHEREKYDFHTTSNKPGIRIFYPHLDEAGGACAAGFVLEGWNLGVLWCPTFSPGSGLFLLKTFFFRTDLSLSLLWPRLLLYIRGLSQVPAFLGPAVHSLVQRWL